MEIFKKIKNYNLLYDIYGYWPYFHDVEIVEFKGDRNAQGTEENYGAIFEMIIRVFEMTNKVDSRGYFILEKHNLVHFRFNNVYDWEFDGFSNQNAILGMVVSVVNNEHLKKDCLKFEFDPADGLGGELKCVSAEIVSIEPCDKNGVKINYHVASPDPKGLSALGSGEHGVGREKNGHTTLKPFSEKPKPNADESGKKI